MFFNLMASGGLYSVIYFNNLQSLINYHCAFWTQFLEHWTHDTDYRLYTVKKILLIRQPFEKPGMPSFPMVTFLLVNSVKAL